jgi:hypothetical protein
MPDVRTAPQIRDLHTLTDESAAILLDYNFVVF